MPNTFIENREAWLRMSDIDTRRESGNTIWIASWEAQPLVSALT
jgi:hypothetical protein